jgi:hypothetical protein
MLLFSNKGISLSIEEMIWVDDERLMIELAIFKIILFYSLLEGVCYLLLFHCLVVF